MQTGCVCVCFFVYGKCVCSFLKKAVPSTRFQESLILLPGQWESCILPNTTFDPGAKKKLISRKYLAMMPSLRNVKSPVL